MQVTNLQPKKQASDLVNHKTAQKGESTLTLKRVPN